MIRKDFKWTARPYSSETTKRYFNSPEEVEDCIFCPHYAESELAPVEGIVYYKGDKPRYAEPVVKRYTNIWVPMSLIKAREKIYDRS